MFSAASKTGSQATAFNYVEDVFSTYLYTGNGSGGGGSAVIQTINNGIDLSGKGGLTWIKNRGRAVNHGLYDTIRGALNGLSSNTTGGQSSYTNTLNGFTSSGFTLGNDSSNTVNLSGDTYCSWTFRKQPKFFDVVTYTGNGGTQAINHALGSTPGMVIIKRTDTASIVGWVTYHRSVSSPNDNYLLLNNTTAPLSAPAWISPTSTNFTIGNYSDVNASGGTFVAYLFAHNAGGFGTTGTDNVISCGSFNSDSSGGISPVNLGYEPQWLLVKNVSGGDGWRIQDVMRGWSQTQLVDLSPNDSGGDRTLNNNPSYLSPTATGFSTPTPGIFTPSNTFAYVAIRRPMKVPTDATTVFSPATRTGTGANATITTSTLPVDFTWIRQTNNTTGYSFMLFDRLRGKLKLLYTDNTQTENNTSATVTGFDVQNGYYLGDDASGYGTNVSGQPIVYYSFSRRPGFFDVVCYTGTGSVTTQTHNLGVVPELMIMKTRSGGGNPAWWVYAQPIGATNYLMLNNTNASAIYANMWNDTTPTTTNFTLGSYVGANNSGSTYVAYLFATCAGVSKVGSYTGNGSTQAIACGFTGGARFVLIKRTDSTGDWYVYDTARGMTTLTDPYLLTNSSAAQSATLGSVTSTAGGFSVNASILSAINTNAASYIFLAIA
jgi:hypothetical protein